jgi:hypothetical protein
MYFMSQYDYSQKGICVLLNAGRWKKINLVIFFFSVALQSLKDLGRLTYRRFLELCRHMVGLLGRVISPSQGLYLHRRAQHRKTRTNIHVLSGIRTYDLSNQPAKTHASDGTATVTGKFSHLLLLKELREQNPDD